MNEPNEFPPPTQPAPDPIAQSAARRLFGFLSGLSNAILIGGIALLGAAAGFEATLSARYPIEHTLRSPTKRPWC